MTKDPVCGMNVNEENPDMQNSEYLGDRYYFCSVGCKEQFDQRPDDFVGAREAQRRSA